MRLTRILAATAFTICLSCGARAETGYTHLPQTPIYDRPSTDGKPIKFIPAETMIETVNSSGYFTAVSYIDLGDGKVHSGYVETSDINVTALPGAPVVTDVKNPIDKFSFSPAILNQFAKEGKLVARRSKMSGKARR